VKVALLSAANCIHTTRWANGLVARGVEIHLISLHPLTHQLDSRVIFHQLKQSAPLGYLTSYIELKEILIKINPNILNVHFATGYGLLAQLTGFKPYLLSVWGSDVYDFPLKSLFHQRLLRSNLKAASAIASTSQCMARRAAETYHHPHVFITPFGVDTEIFSLDEKTKSGLAVAIGTVKTLKHNYGIDTLIESFSILVKKIQTDATLTLEISGGGPDLQMLKALAKDLGVAEHVTFHGEVDHQKVPEMLNRLDIYVALSRLESFGVAILEASSCGKPVVVSDADGPSEVVVDSVTGIIVPRNDPDAAADALHRLVSNPALMVGMGRAGRDHVINNYSWEHSVDLMLRAYQATISLK
jgi:L-malate glycosyltransferase